MTNLKKSYSVSALAILALAFCVMLLSQAVIASQKSERLNDAVLIESGFGGVPLPSGDPVLDRPAVEAVGEESVYHGRGDVLVPSEVDEEGIERFPAPAALAAVPGDACTNRFPIPGAGVYPADLSTVPLGNGNWLTGLPARAFFWTLTAPVMGTYQVRWCDDGTVGLAPVPPGYPCGRYVVMTDNACGAAAYTNNITPYPTLNGRLCGINPTCPGNAPVGPIGFNYFLNAGQSKDFALEVRLGDMLKGNLTVTYIAPVYADDCVLPIQITGPVTPSPTVLTLTQDLTGMNADGPAGYFAQNVWWRFHCMRTGTYTLSTCNTPSCGLDPGPPEYLLTADLMLGVLPDDCFAPASSLLLWNDDGCGPGTAPPWTSTGDVIMVAGQYYMISVGVWPWSDCADPTVQLDISYTPLVPENDLCANAQALPDGPGHNFVFNLDATLDGPLINYCDPSGGTCADVWYTWKSTAAGYAVFDMCRGTQPMAFDSKIEVYRGSACLTVDPRDPDPFGCSDDGCGHYSSGGLVEVACAAGEEFLIRMTGWFSSTTPCNPGGFGFGYMDIFESPTSIRPPNDDCDNAGGPYLLASGVPSTATGNIGNSSWDDCPGLYADGVMNMQWNTYESFELVDCSNMMIDFCGTVELTGDARVSWSAQPGDVLLYTGCPCSGAYVTVAAAARTLGPCVGYPTTSDTNNKWTFNQLIPGVYFFEVSAYTAGILQAGNSDYTFSQNYNLNFTATAIACTYCAATANAGFCPPTANGSWMSDVSFGDLVKNANDNPNDNPGSLAIPNDCHGYEDNSAMVAHLYRGMTYDLSVKMRKLTSPYRNLLTDDDSCVAFIDWNQNSGLAANQTELSEKYAIPGTEYVYNRLLAITVPMDAKGPGEGATGATKMRIRASVGLEGSSVACGLMPTGEVEDFTVAVSDLECGDFNLNGLGPEDIAFLSAWYFGHGPAPDYWQRGDIDGDNLITIADIIALADALYRSGALLCM